MYKRLSDALDILTNHGRRFTGFAVPEYSNTEFRPEKWLSAFFLFRPPLLIGPTEGKNNSPPG